jgi:hypothetical protein
MADYDRLTGLVGSHREMFIFRRFLTLNARNLLSLQAELVNLETELKAIALEDKRSNDEDRMHYSCSFDRLKKSEKVDGKNYQRQKELEVRRALKKYS